MQSKLILSLWIIGGLLYAGSTVFLANTLLGGSAGGKEKSVTLAAAGETQCQDDSLATAEADETKTAAVEPKPAPAVQKPAQTDAKPHATKPDAADESQDPKQDWQPSDEASDSTQDVPGMPGEDQEEGPWYQDQAGMQPDGPMEAEEWAHVIAGTANMRSEPSLQSQLIYALPAGWQVRVISRAPGWVQVQDANSGAAGWVEATALAPGGGPDAGGGHGAYPPRPGDPYRRYADERYPYPPPWERRRERRGDFGNFLGRVFGGF